MNIEVNVKVIMIRYEKILFFERIFYGCGDLGCNIIYLVMLVFLLFYYINYVDVSVVVVGSIMFVFRILDGFSDLIMGIIVDRIKFKYGKVRFWILRMVIFFVIVVVLLFFVLLNFGIIFKLIYIFIIYNLVFIVIYIVINVFYVILNLFII